MLKLQTETKLMETKPPEIIKVAIIEDLRDLREGLATMINFTEGFECAGEYALMEQATAASIRHRLPDIVLPDIGLPAMNGIAKSEALSKALQQSLIK
ncbi:MAG TPA: response regulator [Pyrinomonadaceae bacterium]|jgi:DNA-binding NarL/FixJ family response regulator